MLAKSTNFIFIMKLFQTFMLLLGLCNSGFAQDIDLSHLYNKKWAVAETYIDGWKVEIPVQEGFFMIFIDDQQMESHERGYVTQNYWTFETERKTLVFSNEEIDEKAEMFIHSLSDQMLMCDITTSEGMKVTWVMRPLE